MDLLIALIVFQGILFGVLAYRNHSDARRLRMEKSIGVDPMEYDDYKSVFAFDVREKVPVIQRAEDYLKTVGIVMPLYKFLGMAIIILGGFFTVGWVLFGSMIHSTMGMLVGAIAGTMYLQNQKQKRLDKIENQLITVLGLIASSLRAGSALSQAILEISEEIEEPARSEFMEISQLISLGKPAADSLMEVALRVGSPDLIMVATASKIQSESGGNLAKILDNSIETIHDRQSLRSTLKANTAEGKTAGTVVGSLPIAIVFVVSLINPEYFDPLLSNLGGQIVFGFSIALILGGVYWINKIANTMDVF